MSANNSSTPLDSTNFVELKEYSMTIVVITVVSTLFYGFFILLFSQFITSSIQKGFATRGHKLMFLASTITFVAATVMEGSVIARNVVFLRTILSRYHDLLGFDRLRILHDHMRPLDLVCMWTSSVEVIISDGIVVWRAFVLLKHKQHQWWIALPFFLLLASAAMYLEILVHVGRDPQAKVSDIIFIVAIGLSLGTNVVSTSFISYIYWLHRKDMASWFSGRRHRRTRGEWVLSVFAESGIVFCLFQIAFFVLQFSPVNDPGYLYAEKLFQTIYFGFVAVYPTTVIVLVNSRHNFDQTCFVRTSLP